MKKKIVVFSGAGISAESGVKTFRDHNGLWENHRIEDVASPEGFLKDPKLVLDFYNERSLSDKSAFKSEFSLYGGFRSGAIYDYKKQYFLYPVFNIEPKYYYNIDKRAKEGKNIKNNGANYLSVSVSYIPDWFVISNYKVGNVKNRVRVIPTFGIRRNFGDNFNYEFNAGVGYGYTFDKGKSNSYTAIDLGLKIGYDF